jgi:Holliday junction DNA helicase RuvA
MFSHICGSLVQKGRDYVVIDNQGIGYRLSVPSSAVFSLPDKGTVKLNTYLAVREDGIALYGFPTTAELELFELLLSVSGIGPKAALAVLSVMTPDAFCLAVLQENVRALTAVPGVGPKSAKRLILELKDRVASLDIAAIPQMKLGPLQGDAYSDAVAALVTLGYSGPEAQAAVHAAARCDENRLSAQELLKNALKQLVPTGTEPSPEKGERSRR